MKVLENKKSVVSANIDGYDVTNRVIVSFTLAYDGFIKRNSPPVSISNNLYSAFKYCLIIFL